MSLEHLALGPGREFDLIRGIAARLGATGTGLGDDCAVVTIGGTTIAISIDASLEGVHFRTEWLTYEDIGWRAGVAALSDLAAEGAKPVGVLVSLGGPPDKDPGARRLDLEAIMGGVGSAAASVGAKVLGGDLLRSEKYMVDVCAIGTCDGPVRRAGARAGDGLWLTGELGGPRLALRAWESGARPAAEVARRFARPDARIAAGLWLATHGATAMIDISDGLASDARHLAAASTVGVEILLERVPCFLGADPLVAIASGEEYELLAAMPPSFGTPQAQAFQELLDLPLTRVGRCTAGEGARVIDRGAAIDAPPGFDHFAT
jgi:thiamine-monophosphate kinase